MFETVSIENNYIYEFAVSELLTASQELKFSPFEQYLNVLNKYQPKIFAYNENQFLITWKGETEWQTQTTESIKTELNARISKDKSKNPAIANLQINDNFVRNFCFLAKVLQMRYYGHCIFIGSKMDNLEEICDLAVHIYEFQIEK
uniref:Uncharacterized protein n=1 Tax=Panagrolaimus sp. ES5 TaxID=591445 RepID=A0AC34GJF6_9BILA